MALSPFDSNIYISNHGAKGGDWFGEVTSGSNYGWPVLGWGGTNYSGSKIGPKWLEGFKKPIYYWVNPNSYFAIIIYKGQEFKEWNGSALITSLKDQTLRKLEFTDLKNIKEDIIFSDLIGRIRDIDVHPTNGKIFLLSSNKIVDNAKKKKLYHIIYGGESGIRTHGTLTFTWRWFSRQFFRKFSAISPDNLYY